MDHRVQASRIGEGRGDTDRRETVRIDPTAWTSIIRAGPPLVQARDWFERNGRCGGEGADGLRSILTALFIAEGPGAAGAGGTCGAIGTRWRGSRTRCRTAGTHSPRTTYRPSWTGRPIRTGSLTCSASARRPDGAGGGRGLGPDPSGRHLWRASGLGPDGPAHRTRPAGRCRAAHRAGRRCPRVRGIGPANVADPDPRPARPGRTRPNG